MFDTQAVRIKIANALELTSGVDLDFNKGWCLNEKGCTVAKPPSQLQSQCHSCFAAVGWVWEGVAQAGAIRIFCDKKYCKMQ